MLRSNINERSKDCEKLHSRLEAEVGFSRFLAPSIQVLYEQLIISKSELIQHF